MLRRPTAVELATEPYGHHKLPDHDDFTVRTLVDLVFQGDGLIPALDPALIRRLLNHAPDPQFHGAYDMNRPLRADEIATVFGVAPSTRHDWLLRADEIAHAWGRPLLGEHGLVQVLGSDAPGDLPATDR